MEIFAAFVVAPVGDDIAATTRVNSDKIGLPGGKLEPGESARDAVIREAMEEGWKLSDVAETHYHEDIVDGNPVVWFIAGSATKIDNHKEAGRVEPVVASFDRISTSGFGNKEAILKYFYYSVNPRIWGQGVSSTSPF
jgi:8-oxo-dGTP pyrophosphatase MutT (NUDIX family)